VLEYQNQLLDINTHMKLTEISRQALFETVEKLNDTSISTDDLVKVVEAHDSNIWSQPMTGDEFDAYVQKLTESLSKS
jgi:hypothetical protein